MSEQSDKLKQKLSDAELQFKNEVGEDSTDFSNVMDLMNALEAEDVAELGRIVQMADTLGLTDKDLADVIATATQTYGIHEGLRQTNLGLRELMAEFQDKVKKGDAIDPILGVLTMEEDHQYDSITIRYKVTISRGEMERYNYDPFVFYQGIVAGFALRLNQQRENPDA